MNSVSGYKNSRRKQPIAHNTFHTTQSVTSHIPQSRIVTLYSSKNQQKISLFFNTFTSLQGERAQKQTLIVLRYRENDVK